MNEIKVGNEISVYEVDGNEVEANAPSLTVTSHWNRCDLVVVRIGDGPAVTVAASALTKALTNASNA